jgi:hypothetical protein
MKCNEYAKLWCLCMLREAPTVGGGMDVLLITTQLYRYCKAVIV